MTSLVDFLADPATRWIAGYAIALLVGLVALRGRALTPDGAIAAAIVGGALVAAGGWWPGMALVAFFVSASILSHTLAPASGGALQARGKQRDAVQVLANGGIPVLFAIGSLAAANEGPWLVGCCAAVAGATSDTWGTETGRLNRTAPRLITTGRPAPAGTSGAVSLAGTIGTALGALLIGAVAALGVATGWNEPGVSATQALSIVAAAGFAGALVDSLLGATAQARYRCPTCAESTELLVHSCGTPTDLERGWAWLDNDAVNLLAIAFAGALALLVAWLT